MKRIQNINRYIGMLAIMSIVSSCSSEWLDVNNNPNSPVEPDLELLIPSVEIAMGQVLTDRFDGIGVIGQNMESTLSQYGLGGDGGIPLGFEELYVDALVNAERVINDAELSDPPLTTHRGIAKVLKAYIYHVLIDIWGAAPFDEALLGAEGPEAPTWEDGAEVYPKIITLIDEAIVDLNAGGVSPQNDVIYGGETESWVKFANTLKLKMALNTNNVSLANTAIMDGVIDSNGDDADFQFGTGLAPENRHRMHQLHYTGGTKTFYMSNTLMFKMYKGYGAEGEVDVPDPRMRYYFYRQISTFDDALDKGAVVPDDFPCFGYGARPDDESTWQIRCSYGYVGDGYVGRDHGDGLGIPNDGASRTTFGIYPIGGLFDDGSADVAQQSDISTGGIYPIFTNAMAKFMQAEAALRLGASGDPRALLEAGVRASIDDVMSFGSQASNFDASLAPSEDDVQAYVAAVLARYDESSTNNTVGTEGSQLDVVMEQWYIANFGNNTESWTSLRRTKLPSVRRSTDGGGQPQRMSIIPNNPYPRRMPFPPSELATNPNAPDPNEIVWFQAPVFWDNVAYPARF